MDEDPTVEPEPPRWRKAFLLYLNSPARTVHAAYLEDCRQRGKRARGGTPGAWRAAALRFQWAERARRVDDEHLAEALRCLAAARTTLNLAALAASNALVEMLQEASTPAARRVAALDILDRVLPVVGPVQNTSANAVTVIDFHNNAPTETG